MMWSTNVENILSRRNSFGLGPHFCQQNKHIPLKKMIIRTTCKAVNCFSNVVRVKHSIVTFIYIYICVYFYYVGKICTNITPTNSRAKWEDCMKAWNYIKIDFDQETGQEYSTIVQIIVKADRGKAIARRSVSWKMTCYQIPDEKTLLILNLHFVPTLHSAVYILYPVCSLQYAFCTIRYPWHHSILVRVIRTRHTIYNELPVYELIRHLRSFLR